MNRGLRAAIALTFGLVLLGVGMSAFFASEGMFITFSGRVLYGFWPVFWYGLLVLYPLCVLIIAMLAGIVIGLTEWVLRGGDR